MYHSLPNRLAKVESHRIVKNIGKENYDDTGKGRGSMVLGFSMLSEPFNMLLGKSVYLLTCGLARATFVEQTSKHTCWEKAGLKFIRIVRQCVLTQKIICNMKQKGSKVLLIYIYILGFGP